MRRSVRPSSRRSPQPNRARARGRPRPRKSRKNSQFFGNEFNPAKEMLVRVVAILTKLVLRFHPDQYRVCESVSRLRFEDEDDDEHEED